MYGLKFGLALVVSSLSLISISGCAHSVSELPTVSLFFKHKDGTSTPPFTMEVAATEPDRRKGLMFRNSIAPDRGMAFLFSESKVNSFWMKNTYISLDMVFVSADWKVVGILHDVPPLTEDSRSVGKPSQYVLEFGAGVMAANKVEEGAQVVIDQALPVVR